MNILCFTNDTASKHWRFNGQARLLNENGHEMFITSHKNWTEEWIEPDLVVAQMVRNPRMIDFIHEKGGKVIFEADDLIDSTKRENIDTSEMAIKEFEETIRKCDGVTVTTKKLASVYGKLNKHVWVLPNYLDGWWWGEPEPRPKRHDKTIRIGWAGGRTHYEDLRMVVPVIKRLVDKYDFLRFVYCGYGGMSSDRLLTEVGWGKDVFKEIPQEKREFYIGVDSNFWPKKSRTLDFDIAIAPLIRDKFNECKSNCKWIEYSANKVPGVYSPTVYKDSVKHGVTGYIAETDSEWEHYLEKLILNEEIRESIAEEANKEIKNKWLIKDHWKDWEKVYKEVVYG